MRTLTAPSRFLHWLIVGSFALVGLGILVILLWIVMVEEEHMAILALIFTAPIWLMGLVAAAEGVRLLRSRNELTERRASRVRPRGQFRPRCRSTRFICVG